MGGRQLIVIYDEDNGQNSEGKLTAPIIIVYIVVASIGLMWGYETGSYGGVTNMKPFLKKFFPAVLHSKSNVNHDQFCVYESPKLSAYASSLYITGIVSAIMAGRLTTSAGRKGALIIGGLFYLIGVGLQVIAVNSEMLTFGRILIGFGTGFSTQAAPMYLVEMAPTKWRGAIATGFQLFFEIGLFASKWVNLYLIQNYSKDDRGWRISLGLSGLPASIMTIIAFFIPDTPASLIQRGKLKAALKSLNHVRSVDVDTETEFKYLINYYEAVRNASEKPYQMLFERKYRPQLMLAIAIPAFRQLTGIHLVGNLRSLLFRSLSFSFYQIFVVTLTQGTIVIISVLVATLFIDRVGRRMLLLVAGILMFICLVVLAIITEADIDPSGLKLFSKRSAITALFLVGSINATFAWSWGAIVWVIPGELLSIEVRSAANGLSLAFSFWFQFVAIQIMFRLLCYFKYGAFLFHAGWVLIMTIFVILFVPETKRIPLESMDDIIWRSHWYWKRFVNGTNTLRNQGNDRLS